MKLVSYVIDSFQEFEGYQSIVLFCYGCNLNCPRCYNRKIVTDENNIIGEAIEVLYNKLNPMHDAIVLLGGEPTVWEDSLIILLEQIRMLGLKVKLFTNGYNHSIIKQLNNNYLVDAYSVDLKCLKSCSEILGIPISDKEYIERVRKSIESIINANISLEIRTTKWANVNHIDEIKAYVKREYPDVPHLLTEDFLLKNKHLTEVN